MSDDLKVRVDDGEGRTYMVCYREIKGERLVEEIYRLGYYGTAVGRALSLFGKKAIHLAIKAEAQRSAQ